MSLTDWVQTGRKLNASDLHVETGTPLVARVRGELVTVGEPIPSGYLAQVAEELLGAEPWAQFKERGSADVSNVVAGMRCRINLYRTLRGVAIAVRILLPFGRRICAAAICTPICAGSWTRQAAWWCCPGRPAAGSRPRSRH